MKKSGILLIAAAAVICSALILLARSGINHLGGDPIITNTSSPIHNVHETPPLFTDTIQTSGFTVMRQATYKNLQVFILKGDAYATERNYTTLQHALQNKMVIVRETGDVNELKIDNNSGEFIYINSGDIVKGGRQDRTIQYDVIIPPNRQDVDLASFCVEHGRWTKRENESDANFAASDNSLSSKELKIAAKHLKSQQEVWKKVGEYQEKTNKELKKGTADSASIEVKSAVSESSLQLTLDNKFVIQSKDDYKQQLAAQIKEMPGATGLAYCINGKLYSIELFNNQKLFADMYDKLLDAAITEAISEEVSNKTYSDNLILDSLFKTNINVYEDNNINELTKFQSAEPAGFTKWILFTTIDNGLHKWLHRNWLDKTSN